MEERALVPVKDDSEADAWLSLQLHQKDPAKRRRRVKKIYTMALLSVFVFFIVAVARYSPPKAENLRNDPPKCEIFPILTSNHISGAVNFTNTDKILNAKLSVWETTQERLLYSEDLSEEAIRTGNYTFPDLNFYDDYIVHFEEYSGFEEKGDYKQEIRVNLRYDSGSEGIKSRTFTQQPMEAYLCWLQKANKKHGSALVKEGYITEIVHTPLEAARISDCYIEQAERVHKIDSISVRVTVDGQPVIEKPYSEKVNSRLLVVRIPIPEGMSEDGTHNLQIYVTQYISGFRKSMEFLVEDTF